MSSPCFVIDLVFQQNNGNAESSPNNPKSDRTHKQASEELKIFLGIAPEPQQEDGRIRMNRDKIEGEVEERERRKGKGGEEQEGRGKV